MNMPRGWNCKGTDVSVRYETQHAVGKPRVRIPIMRDLRWSALTLASFLMVPLSTMTLSAQTTFGVRAGVSVSSIDADFDQTFDDSNRTGFVGGVFLDFGGADSFLGFQVGAQYTQKGAELDIGGTVEDLSLNYLEVPAVVKLGIPLTVVEPSVFGGVGLGFNTSCEFETGGGCDDSVTSTEFSGIAGADVEFDLGGLNVFVDGRYHFGLNDISDAADINELKNRAWQFQAGLGFPFGG